MGVIVKIYHYFFFSIHAENIKTETKLEEDLFSHFISINGILASHDTN